MSRELFQRVEDFDAERFEDELLLMHRETRRTLTLNAPAAALWEALQWPQTRDQIAALLAEARPDEDQAALRAHVDGLLDSLIDAGFVVSFESGS